MNKRPKIFGIGFQKTGTSSLDSALRILGYRTNAGILINNPRSRRGIWIEPPITTKKVAAIVLPLARKYDAVSDNPWPLLFRELDIAYPGSKFILTLRHRDRWLSSLVRHFAGKPRAMFEWLYGFEMPDGHEDECLAVYEAHNEMVRAYFCDRPDDLLEIDFEQTATWKDLCRFLNVAIPNVAFPHANSAQVRENKDVPLLRRLRKAWLNNRSLPDGLTAQLHLSPGGLNWRRKSVWRKVLHVAGRNMLVCKLADFYFCAIDKKTPIGGRLAILAAFLYFVSPVDLIPDFVPAIGLSDDALVIALCAYAVSSCITQQHRDRATAALRAAALG
ncbi:MAG TPA: sulfotransferase [Rhizomicrobium sp.]|nr:sulfotransferase [Rhizomicrobium sp.]